jgi:hypothetical protein
MTPDENLFRQLWSDTSITPWHQRSDVGRVIAVLLASAAVTGTLTWATCEIRDTANVGTSRNGLFRDAMNRSLTIDRSILVAAALVGAANTTAVHAQQSTYAEAVLASQPSGYWRFEEVTGSANGTTVNAPAGEFFGSIQRGMASASPSLGLCQMFSNGGIRIPFSAESSVTANSTIELWAKATEVTSPAHLVSIGRDISVGSVKCTIYGAASSRCFNADFGNNGSYGTWYASDQDLNQWHHYVFVRDAAGGVCSLYVDGQQRDQREISSVIATIQAPLVIGMHDVPGFPYYFRGLIDEVAIYQRALTESEILAHYCAAGVDSTTCCPADLYPNGVVNGADLGILLSEWGSATPVSADLNGDGTVDGIDLGALLGAWGPCVD